MTRLLIINPNSSEPITAMIAESAYAAAPHAEVEVFRNAGAPLGINTIDDEERAISVLMDSSVIGRLDDFDAIVMACFGDPGVDNIQAHTSRPVTGIARSTMEYAGRTHGGFAIVAASHAANEIMAELVKSYGLEPYCRFVASLGIDAEQIAADGDEAFPAIWGRMRRSVLGNDVESIILGCTALAPLATRLTAELSLPVIDPVHSAVRRIIE